MLKKPKTHFFAIQVCWQLSESREPDRGRSSPLSCKLFSFVLAAAQDQALLQKCVFLSELPTAQADNQHKICVFKFQRGAPKGASAASDTTEVMKLGVNTEIL